MFCMHFRARTAARDMSNVRCPSHQRDLPQEAAEQEERCGTWSMIQRYGPMSAIRLC